MDLWRTLESDLAYVRRLSAAGWNGATTVPQTLDSPKLEVLTPTMIGVGIGLLSGGLLGKQRRAPGAAIGGLLGGVAGFGAGFAWGWRGVVAGAARNAARSINEVRDARWLEQNPIDYA